MAIPVIMPKQGQSVESCIISEIRKKKGDRVKTGEVLFTYETDKAAFDEEAKADGYILEFFFLEGDEVPVFTTVCVIGNEGESADEFRPGGTGNKPAQAQADVITEKESILEGGSGIVSEAATGPETKVVRNQAASSGVSPRARSLAEKTGIEASTLSGTGPQGRVIERDVREAADAGKLTPLARKLVHDDPSLHAGAGTGLAGSITSRDLQKGMSDNSSDFEIKPLTNIRKLIARAMYESLRNSAQLTHHLGADARRINELRRKIKKGVEAGTMPDITLNDMICFATIRALKIFPQVNAHLLGDSVKSFRGVHLGLAVDTERGLMVPAIRNADTLNITELSFRIKETAAACRRGSVVPELLSSEAASFTVSNLGNYGVEIFTPVINLPQVAILGVNTIVLRPKDLGDGVIGFVPFLGLSLTYDHRAIDGGEATRFVKQVAIEIENLEFDILNK
jgi:pyruvate dehydrogenase E2 component (dihydrolipoamide acetyltransferase)